MVESWPPPALVVPEPDLLLHIKVIALNSPAHFHEIDQLAEWHLFIYGGEPILGRLSFALGPFNQQRFFGPACSAPDRCRAYPHAGKARAQPLVGSLTPSDRAPSMFGSRSAKLLTLMRLPNSPRADTLRTIIVGMIAAAYVSPGQ